MSEGVSASGWPASLILLPYLVERLQLVESLIQADTLPHSLWASEGAAFFRRSYLNHGMLLTDVLPAAGAVGPADILMTVQPNEEAENSKCEAEHEGCDAERPPTPHTAIRDKIRSRLEMPTAPSKNAPVSAEVGAEPDVRNVERKSDRLGEAFALHDDEEANMEQENQKQQSGELFEAMTPRPQPAEA